ncbi:MAG TPA: hypothetical protein VGR58_10775 [Candidatus Acidoferrum sp.]|nr:hypothetical protein [Candidatus Acidoferrum sp.]
MEVEQQANSISREFQVSEHNSFVDWCNLLYGFQFNYDSVLDQDIDPVAAFEFHVFVDDRHWFLALMCDTAQDQFFAKTLLISRFKQAWAKKSMNLDGSADDFVGQFHV